MLQADKPGGFSGEMNFLRHFARRALVLQTLNVKVPMRLLREQLSDTSMTKTAIITGITGQDGSYLAELLLEKGYVVHGIKRRASSFNTSRIDHLYQDPHEQNPRLVLHYGNLTDSTNLIRIIQQVQPDEIYNLGAQSHVAVSFEAPEYTANSDALGKLRILEALRMLVGPHQKNEDLPGQYK